MKKKLGAQIWVKGAKIRPETRFFCHFLKFGLLVVLKIAYIDRLQHCITSSIGKTYEKKIGGIKFGPKRSKIGP